LGILTISLPRLSFFTQLFQGGPKVFHPFWGGTWPPAKYFLNFGGEHLFFACSTRFFRTSFLPGGYLKIFCSKRTVRPTKKTVLSEKTPSSREWSKNLGGQQISGRKSSPGRTHREHPWGNAFLSPAKFCSTSAP